MSIPRKSPPIPKHETVPRNTILRDQVETLRQTLRSRPTMIEEWEQEMRRDDSAELAVMRLTRLKVSGKM
ncbi:hypothetical protein [Methylobacterium frigidaeris]|uniref:Uncharacterized protein n=2 Tax=Methylobacterium frigidaeris TaxID=2038277 RepID=A0AA37M506_9HYPH|nr:hypothetical protein [Methylobacterium frigidaeris]GJD63143.1 hypothetical protein MPEAHAMD_3305 [Methylobacterium frigidaeris]